MSDDDEARLDLEERAGEAWGDVDLEGNGVLDADELAQVLNALGVEEQVEADALFGELDEEEMGLVEWETFSGWYIEWGLRAAAGADDASDGSSDGLGDLLDGIDLDDFEDSEGEGAAQAAGGEGSDIDDDDLLAGLDDLDDLTYSDDERTPPRPAAPPEGQQSSAGSVRSKAAHFAVREARPVEELLVAEPHERQDHEVEVLLEWSQQIKGGFFDALTSNALRKEVCRRLVGESFAEAQTICRQGEIGEKFYVIVRGSVSVQVEGAGEVAVLEPGGSFGELSLTGEGEERRRNATCVAQTPTLLGSLDRLTYRQLVESVAGWGADLRVLRSGEAVQYQRRTLAAEEEAERQRQKQEQEEEEREQARLAEAERVRAEEQAAAEAAAAEAQRQEQERQEQLEAARIAAEEEAARVAAEKEAARLAALEDARSELVRLRQSGGIAEIEAGLVAAEPFGEALSAETEAALDRVDELEAALAELKALLSSTDFLAVVAGVEKHDELPGECKDVYEQLLDHCEALVDGANETLRAVLQWADDIAAIDAAIEEHEPYAEAVEEVVMELLAKRDALEEAAEQRQREEEAAAAAEEAARVAAEEEAARVAAEKEAARLAAEKEAARLAAEREENERRMALEAQRAEAARLQAAEEEAARVEAARVAAAEEEARRIAAEQEALRLAEEQEAARLAAEESRLIAAEEEARLAAEQAEAARVAAEENAARKAAERAAAEKRRQEAEAARIAAEQERAAAAAAAEEERRRQEAAEAEAARVKAEEEAAAKAREEEEERARLLEEEEAAEVAALEEMEALAQLSGASCAMSALSRVGLLSDRRCATLHCLGLPHLSRILFRGFRFRLVI